MIISLFGVSKVFGGSTWGAVPCIQSTMACPTNTVLFCQIAMASSISSSISQTCSSVAFLPQQPGLWRTPSSSFRSVAFSRSSASSPSRHRTRRSRSGSRPRSRPDRSSVDDHCIGHVSAAEGKARWRIECFPARLFYSGRSKVRRSKVKGQTVSGFRRVASSSSCTL